MWKILPVTPVLLAHRYLAETGADLGSLARKIIDEQEPKLTGGWLFYDPALMDRYAPWAEANLGLWRAIRDALRDPDVHQVAADHTP